MRISDRAQNYVALALVLLLASGCVGVGTTTAPPGQTASQTLTPGTTASPESTGDPGRPTERPNGNLEKFIAWIVGLGPGSPQGPPEVGAYVDIQTGTETSCLQALQTDLGSSQSNTLYHGAAAACLAALHDKAGRWDDAQQALAELQGRPAGCLDQATFDLLKATVDAHVAYPAAVFRIEPGRGNAKNVRLPCPRIQDVTVTRESGELKIEVRGMRLAQVLRLVYAPVDSCPQPDDMTGLSLESNIHETSVRGTVTGDDEALNAPLMWVGVIAEPDDWVAAADCVPIHDAEPTDLSPGPSD